MKVYEGQVGGHLGTLFKSTDRILKPCSHREVTFYQTVQSDEYKDLRCFLPKFFGSKLVTLPETDKEVLDLSL